MIFQQSWDYQDQKANQLSENKIVEYRNRQAVKTFRQRSVEIFDRYLGILNKQRDKDGNLTKV